MVSITATNNDTFFTLVTEKGKTVEVSFGSWGVAVYVPTKRNPLPLGKTFSNLAEALESYKDKQIKLALYTLIES